MMMIPNYLPNPISKPVIVKVIPLSSLLAVRLRLGLGLEMRMRMRTRMSIRMRLWMWILLLLFRMSLF